LISLRTVTFQVLAGACLVRKAGA